MRPRFSLSLGAHRSTSDTTVGLPERIVAERAMDTPADSLRVRLGGRTTAEPGDPATLELGYDSTETVFTGVVTEVLPSSTGTEVRALGGTLSLLRLRVSAGYERRTAGAIIRDLADRAGMDTGTIDEGDVLPFYAVDLAVSGYSHVRALADRFGFEVYTTRDGALNCHAPRPFGTRTYTYGRDLLAVSGKLHAARPAPMVGGESPSSETGEKSGHWLSTDELIGRPPSPGTGTPLVLDPAARTQDLADRFALGYATTGGRGDQTVRLRVLGLAAAELGEQCGAAGELPEALARSGYLRAVRHELDTAGGWITELSINPGASIPSIADLGGLL